MGIGNHIDAFIRSRRGEGKKEAGVRRYRDCLRRFDRWLTSRGITLEQLDSLVVCDYRDYCAVDRSNRPSTVEKALVSIRAFSNWATKRGLMSGDPTRDIEWPPRRIPAPKPLSPAELAALVDILEDWPDGGMAYWRHARNRVAIYLMYYAGLRLGEVSRLLVRDVNLVSNIVTIRESKGRDRSVALHPDLIRELTGWIAGMRQTDAVVPAGPSGRPVKRPAIIAKIFERWLPQRGLRISAHRLRHSFGTELLRACGNLGVVQKAMGHASPETTMMYAMVTVEDQRPHIHRLPKLKKD